MENQTLELERLLLFLRWSDDDAGYEAWSRELALTVYYPNIIDEETDLCALCGQTARKCWHLNR